MAVDATAVAAWVGATAGLGSLILQWRGHAFRKTEREIRYDVHAYARHFDGPLNGSIRNAGNRPTTVRNSVGISLTYGGDDPTDFLVWWSDPRHEESVSLAPEQVWHFEIPRSDVVGLIGGTDWMRDFRVRLHFRDYRDHFESTQDFGWRLR